MPGSKNIIVCGAQEKDNTSLVGSLVYKCGLDIVSLEGLEKAGKQSYADIPSFLQSKGLRPKFYTKENLCSVVDNPSIANVILLLIDVTSSTQEVTNFLEGWNPPLAERDGPKLVVLVDKMEQVDWNTERYTALLHTIGENFERKQWTDVPFIPISTTKGDNILELSERSTLLPRRIGACPKEATLQTVIQAIDA